MNKNHIVEMISYIAGTGVLMTGITFPFIVYELAFGKSSDLSYNLYNLGVLTIIFSASAIALLRREYITNIISKSISGQTENKS